MDWLKRINWQDHDGVNLRMLNDVVRNQFYYDAMRHVVRGRKCLDIGFGTGLLSIMALDLGADHITAYESDEDRYALGLHVIETLGLIDRIELINQHFHSSDLAKHDVTVAIHETFGFNLWQEGFHTSLPLFPKVHYVPDRLTFQLRARFISRDLATGLLQSASQHDIFRPGVEVRGGFVDTINKLMNTETRRDADFSQDLQFVPINRETDWGWDITQKLADTGAVVTNYQVDVDHAQIITNEGMTSAHGTDRVVMRVDTAAWTNQVVLLTPRVGVSSSTGGGGMWLDQGHWGPAHYPVVLINPQAPLEVTHDLTTGNIEYRYI